MAPRLPDDISLDLGALLEPLSVAMHASHRAALPAGATVLVFGAGAVGLLAAAVSKGAGARRVLIADINGDRIDFAVRHGFADAGILVPLGRPQTIDDKLAYARGVADQVKATEVDGEAVGEVTAVYECTGVETCVQASIYVQSPAPTLTD
jgi:L-iditol 2-dehydrogenase